MDFFNPDKLLQGLAHFGITPPADLTAAVAIRSAAVAAAATHPMGDLEADLLDGKVKPKDVAARVHKAALELTATDNAHRIVANLDDTFKRILRRAARAGAEEIIATLKPIFADRVTTLTASADIIGYTQTPEAILNLGPAAATAWQQMRDAVSDLDRIHRIRVALGNAGYGDGRDPVWYIATLTATRTLEDAQAAFSKDKVAGLAAAGFTLRLNTLAEADQVLADGAQAIADAKKAAGLADPAVQAHNARVRSEAGFKVLSGRKSW